MGRVPAAAPKKAPPIPPPDWDSGCSASGPRGWKPNLVRFYPAPDGRKQPVRIEVCRWQRHHHVDITPARNPVWDGKWWGSWADDPEVQRPPHRNYVASFERKDRAMRWIRQVLVEHFPAEIWVAIWPEGWDPATLRDDPAEEARVRSCSICNGPRSEHTPEQLAECDAFEAEFQAAPAGAARTVLPVSRAGRTLGLRKAKGATACKVLVDPGVGPITGIVGREIAVLPDMHPDQVPLLSRVKALVVERGGATVHLAQVAAAMGVAVVLLVDATLRYKEGQTVTIAFGKSQKGTVATL